MPLNGTVDASWVRKRGGSGLFDLRLREETDHTNLIQLSIKFLSPKTRKSRDQILELSNVKCDLHVVIRAKACGIRLLSSLDCGNST